MHIVGKARIVLDDAIVVGRSYEHASYIAFGKHSLHGSAVGMSIYFGD